jgi:hypothetical protein
LQNVVLPAILSLLTCSVCVVQVAESFGAVLQFRMDFQLKIAYENPQLVLFCIAMQDGIQNAYEPLITVLMH